MPDPTRPVDDATIATDWGQAVHDQVFTPKGCEVHGVVTNIGSTLARLDLSVVDDDPGGWLVAASDELEAPADTDGLYWGAGVVQVDESTERFRIALYHNGTKILSMLVQGEGSTSIQEAIGPRLFRIAAGDTVYFEAQRTTGSGSGELRVLSWTMLRAGSELGA